MQMLATEESERAGARRIAEALGLFPSSADDSSSQDEVISLINRIDYGLEQRGTAHYSIEDINAACISYVAANNPDLNLDTNGDGEITMEEVLANEQARQQAEAFYLAIEKQIKYGVTDFVAAQRAADLVKYSKCTPEEAAEVANTQAVDGYVPESQEALQKLNSGLLKVALANAGMNSKLDGLDGEELGKIVPLDPVGIAPQRSGMFLQ